MSVFIVDCEADGPVPGPYSLVSLGAVLVYPNLDRTFYGTTRPISSKYIPEALAISGHSREEHYGFEDPKETFEQFEKWLEANSYGRPIFMSDNLAFDWQWVNWYFHYFLGRNPFGFSGRRIGDLYSGLQKDWFAASKWKSMRKTKHSHNPVDDALGNAEALMEMCRIHGIKLPS